MRRAAISFILLWVCVPTYAQEVSVFYGKGIGAEGVAEANPNQDLVAILLQNQIKGEPNLSWHTYLGQCNGGVMKSENGDNSLGSRPFVSFGTGVEYRREYKDIHFHSGLGLSLVARTTDGPQYAVAPHFYVSLAYEYRRVEYGMAVFQILRPNISDSEWNGGRRWESPLFSGFFFQFKTKRTW